MKVGIIVQARTLSKNFPNKIFAELDGKPVIEHCLERLKNLEIPLVVAIPSNKEDDVLYNWLIDRGYQVFRGKQHDVLDRFYQCAKKNQFETVIRVCADTPFIDIQNILYHLRKFNIKQELSYGDGCWVFSIDDLEWAWSNCPEPKHRENVWTGFGNIIDYERDIERIDSRRRTVTLPEVKTNFTI